jgi:oligopeptide/dipeptide ABC transporter ATP-binding protein
MPRRALRSVRGAEIGFVSQNPFGVLNPILTVADQFYDRFKAHRRGVTEAESRKAARGMLEAVGISASDRVLSGYAHELSGGMAQRVAIAMALILDPRLIIADEPTTALDVTVQKQILDLLRSLIAGSARSMLLVTHDLGVVAQYCDEVIVMYAGTVVESGPVETVLISPEHPYTDALIRSVPRRGYPIEALPGRAPSLLAQPVGCPLHDRCKHALDTCAIARPELEARSSGRMVRCNVDWKESA